MEPDLSRSGPLAQVVEHRTFNPLVAGSIPAGPTKTTESLTEKPWDFSLARRSLGACLGSKHRMRFSGLLPGN